MKDYLAAERQKGFLSATNRPSLVKHAITTADDVPSVPDNRLNARDTRKRSLSTVIKINYFRLANFYFHTKLTTLTLQKNSHFSTSSGEMIIKLHAMRSHVFFFRHHLSFFNYHIPRYFFSNVSHLIKNPTGSFL